MIDFSKSKYSPKVLEFLKKPISQFKPFTLLDGSVRSAKTISIILKMPAIMYELGNDGLYCLSGYSKNTVKNNVLMELIPYLKNYHNAKIKYNSGTGELDVKLWGKDYNFVVVGGGKAGSDATIQGGSWVFWYANELARHNYSFYNMALTRLSCQGARALCDTNPESSNHWLYQEKVKPYIENDENIRSIFEHWRFIMDDNHNLTPEYIEAQKKMYQGAFYARKILGDWVVADGLVYDSFSPDRHVISHNKILEFIKDGAFIDYFIGLDWGWEHPTAACLYGVTSKGIYYQIDELKRTHCDHTQVSEWIKQKQTEYGKFFRFVNADNARPEQNDYLRKTILTYENKPASVADSVAIVRQLINYDRLIISEKCIDTIQEITTYHYPDKQDIRLTTDIDKPVKEFDDLMDAKRYGLVEYETRFGRNFKRV